MNRKRFQGIMNVLRFNWHFYVVGLFVCIGGSALAFFVEQEIVKVVVIAGVCVVLFWLMSSLVVSYYVYDASPLYNLNWLSDIFEKKPERWANIHAGFDETSKIIGEIFPNSTAVILDIYDPKIMTEVSIARARKLSPAELPAIPTSHALLPVKKRGLDGLFLMFTCHELRDHEHRLAFFRELERVISVNGKIVIVEHVRDLMNFVAFGPGFFHFMPEKEWVNVAEKASLKVSKQFRITPFIAVLVVEKADDY